MQQTYEELLTTWHQSQEYDVLKSDFEFLLQKVNRNGIELLLHDLPTKGMSFYDCPASTKYHGCQPGGLLIHSLQVYEVFEELVKQYCLKITEESIIVVSLLHDLCKWNQYEPNLYKVPYQGNPAGSFKADHYSFNDLLPLGHSIKSLMVIQKYITLTEQEQLLIRWHMGPFDKEYFDVQNKLHENYPECIWFHCADQMATLLEEKEGMKK